MGFGPFGYAKRFMNDPNYDIKVATCISPVKDRNLWIADHGYLKPTYSKEESNYLDGLSFKIPFYKGENYAKVR